MSLGKFYKRLKKKVKKGVNKLNPFKLPKMSDQSPVGSAMQKRMKKRMGGEGYVQAYVEEPKTL